MSYQAHEIYYDLFAFYHLVDDKTAVQKDTDGNHGVILALYSAADATADATDAAAPALRGVPRNTRACCRRRSTKRRRDHHSGESPHKQDAGQFLSGLLFALGCL